MENIVTDDSFAEFIDQHQEKENKKADINSLKHELLDKINILYGF